MKRAAAFGCRSFLVYDEGCLWLLNEMRKAGEIPADCHLRYLLMPDMEIRVLPGSGNAGAHSVNPVRDIQLQMLAAMRQAINVPIDIHTENPKSTGGFIRHYEVPEMIRVAAPIYLKTGGSVAQTHSWESTTDDAKKRAKQVSLVQRMIDNYYPEAIGSKKGSIR